MKMRLMRWMGIMAVVVGAGAGLTASAESYYLASRTNMPPMPVNAWPGYPVNSVGGNSYIVDDLSDAAVLSRGLMMMEMDAEPPPIGEGTNAPAATDTNAWIGTWIHGLMSPQNTNTGLPHSREPALWAVLCTNANNSDQVHQLLPWNGWVKVCPYDRVAVLYPLSCASFPAGWESFLIVQRGTNSSGGCWTNAYKAVMDNAVHDAGNWAIWDIPAWPEYFPNSIPPDCIYTIYDYFDDRCSQLFTNTVVTNGVTNITVEASSTNHYTLTEIVCPTLHMAGEGPETWTTYTTNWVLTRSPEGSIIWEGKDPHANPNKPAPPLEGPPVKPWEWCPPKRVEPSPNPVPAGMPPGSIPSKLNGWTGIALSDGYYQTVTNVAVYSTNTVWYYPLKVHGLPGYSYTILQSTNPASTNWDLAGGPGTNSTFIMGDEGVAGLWFTRTNASDIQPTLFWRLRSP